MCQLHTIGKEDAIVDINQKAFEALAKYFGILEHVGYVNTATTQAIIIYSFIQELLSGPMALYVTEEDYREILTMLECLKDGCIIPFDINMWNSLPGIIPIQTLRTTASTVATGSILLNTNNNFRLNIQS